MPFAFAADLHMATSGFRSEVPAGDGFTVLEILAHEVVKRGIPLVLGGDIFDVSRPLPWVINRTCRVLEKCVPTGLYFIQGNHDKHMDEAWLDGMKGARRLTPLPVEIGGHTLAGLDYTSGLHLLEQVEKIEAATEIVCHQAFKQGLGFDGAWNADLDDKQWRRFPNIWVGDLHRPQELWDKKKKVRAVYPGALWPRNVGEAGCAGYLVVGDEKDKKGRFGYDRLELPARPVVRLTIDDEDQLEEAMASEEFMASICAESYQELPEQLRQPIVYVTYYRDIIGVDAAINAALESLGGGYYVSNPLPPRNGFAAEVGQSTGDSTAPKKMADLIAEKMGDHPDVRDFGVDLASCQTMEEVRMKIDQWREKILNKEEAA